MWIPTIVARQRLSKHVTAETNTHATIEELLDASFSMRSVSYQRQVGDQFFPELLVMHMASPHACYMSVPYNLPRCNFIVHMRWRVQIIKLFLYVIFYILQLHKAKKMAILHMRVGHRLTVTHGKVHSLHIVWNRDFKVSLRGCNV
jgi:hypothetical protein